jgi:hypothetical protein
MSIVPLDETSEDDPGDNSLTPVLHRIASVRRLQGLSCRTVARKLNMDVTKVKLQERPNSDLLLSQLYDWQQVLDVPIHELLVESGDHLASPVMRRAQLVRIMKTAMAIQETAKQEGIGRMAQTLIEQLKEVMPELEHVTAWHTVGKRRRRDEYGVAAERRLSDNIFLDLLD